jgi:PAS domain S-box-containing protein
MANNSGADELSFINEPGVAHTLRVMLLAFLAAAIAISVLTFFLGWQLTPQLSLVAAVSSLVALFLFRSGRLRPAMMLAWLGVLYAVMHAAARSDGIQNIGLVFVPVLIVVASLLLDRRLLVLFTAVAILATCGMLAIRYFVLREEPYSTNDMGDLFIFAVICAMAALLGRLLVSRIKEGFQKVRASEGRYRDISEQLRRRAEELQKIMDVAPVALFVAKDPECREVVINRLGNALFEFPPGANSPYDPAGPTPPGTFFRNGVEVPARELPLQRAARGLEVRDAEFEVLLPGGSTRLLWGHASPLRDAAGEVRGAIAIAQDVTEERRRTAALLRESEERFRNTADTAPVILWYGDTKKRLTFVNQETIRFTGLPAEKLLGDGWMDVIHPDDLEPARKAYYEGVDRRASYQLEYRARRADGEYRNMLGTTSPRYAGNMYLGQAGSVVDVTDLKRRQDEGLARQKLESVGALASGIAHDFNNLLGSVLAQAELGLEDSDSGVSPKEELAAIRDVAIRGSEVVRQLLVYAGKESPVAGLVDVSCIVTEMLQLIKISVSKHALLQIDLGNDLPAVRANAGQVRQIVMNLIMNASDAIGESDGTIRVSTKCVKVGRKSCVSCSDELTEGDYVRLEVSDTGSGMSQDVQAKVFDPFFTTKSAGRGLGLAVVQGIVRSLHGAIQIASEQGKGTTLKVLLPCDPSDADAGKQSVSPFAGSATSCNGAVLIVEDEDPLRQAVVKMLRNSGFQVLEAANGSAALDLLHASGGDIHAMLLDMTLPGASSYDIVAEIAKAWPHIRVILTSAYSQQMLNPLSTPQLRGFIRKPYQLGSVVQTLREACSTFDQNI